MNYLVVAFNNSTQKFMHHYSNCTSKKQAIIDFESHYENYTVVNVIEL